MHPGVFGDRSASRALRLMLASGASFLFTLLLNKARPHCVHYGLSMLSAQRSPHFADQGSLYKASISKSPARLCALSSRVGWRRDSASSLPGFWHHCRSRSITTNGADIVHSTRQRSSKSDLGWWVCSVTSFRTKHLIGYQLWIVSV